jgi:hypothetical protein
MRAAQVDLTDLPKIDVVADAKDDRMQPGNGGAVMQFEVNEEKHDLK